MKKSCILAAAMLLAATSAKALEPADTIISNLSVDSVAVSVTDNATTIVISGLDGADGQVNYVFPKTDNTVVRTHNTRNETHGFFDKVMEKAEIIKSVKSGCDWDIAFGGLGFGWNLALDKNPASMQLRANKSWDITWLYAVGAKYKIRAIKADISFGLGFDWKNYRVTDGPWFVPVAGNSVGLGEAPEGVNARLSRLKVFSLSVPVIYRQNLPIKLPFCNSPMQVAVGPVVNFNTHGSLLNKWVNPDGVEVEQTTDRIAQRKVTVDVYGAIFLNSWLGVYARYAPMTVLRRGPEFKSVTIGLTLSW